MAEQGKEKPGIWSRRDFFTRLGWGGFGIFGIGILIGFVRSAFPRVLFQPPATFKAGLPSDYAPGEVSEKFKQVTGINFVDYVALTRVAKAGDLLQDRQVRISEIAFAVGFQSLSQFNRVFKRLTGKSPTQFRGLLQASKNGQ